MLLRVALMSRMPTTHTTAVGPVLSIAESRPTIVEGSFRLKEVQKASAGFTVYRVDFQVCKEPSLVTQILSFCFISVEQVKILAPDGTPVLQEVVCNNSNMQVPSACVKYRRGRG